MIEAMEHFSEYLCYKEFVLFTDHQPLTWLKRQKGLHGKLWRWAFRIKQFNFKIKYRKAKKMQMQTHFLVYLKKTKIQRTLTKHTRNKF